MNFIRRHLPPVLQNVAGGVLTVLALASVGTVLALVESARLALLFALTYRLPAYWLIGLALVAAAAVVRLLRDRKRLRAALDECNARLAEKKKERPRRRSPGGGWVNKW